jgi:hypothetical protein
MSERAVPTTSKDGLITFGATYVMLTAAGILATHLWTWAPDRVASLAPFASLVALYTFCTGPGRRTGWLGFLLCGALVPGAVVLLAIADAAQPYSDGGFEVREALTSGLEVGYRVESPTGLLLWMLEIGLVIQIGPLLRQFVRKFTAR